MRKRREEVSTNACLHEQDRIDRVWWRKCTDSGDSTGSRRRKGVYTGEEYEKDIVAAALTPGALPVEIATGVGKAVSRKKGNDSCGDRDGFPVP